MRKRGWQRYLLVVMSGMVCVCLFNAYQQDLHVHNTVREDNGDWDTTASFPSHTRVTEAPVTPEQEESHHYANVCAQQQRLARIDSMCEKYYGHAPKAHLIDNMTDAEVKRLSQEFFVLDEFGVLGCLSWKTGSTSWTLMFMNNTAPTPMGASKTVNYEKALAEAKKTHRVLKLDAFSAPEIRKRLKTYWKFLTVRHPLDRLVSAYNDKLVNDKRYRSQLSAKIFRKYKHLNRRKQISFTDFLRYIRDGGEDLFDHDGGHWHDLMVRCQPCTVDYDYVARTETHFLDSQYVIQHKMRGRGIDLKTKSWRESINVQSPYFGRTLRQFEPVPDDLFNDIIKHYEKDFEVYGYSFERQNGSVVTACTAAENNGDKCC